MSQIHLISIDKDISILKDICNYIGSLMIFVFSCPSYPSCYIHNWIVASNYTTIVNCKRVIYAIFLDIRIMDHHVIFVTLPPVPSSLVYCMKVLFCVFRLCENITHSINRQKSFEYQEQVSNSRH